MVAGVYDGRMPFHICMKSIVGRQKPEPCPARVRYQAWLLQKVCRQASPGRQCLWSWARTVVTKFRYVGRMHPTDVGALCVLPDARYASLASSDICACLTHSICGRDRTSSSAIPIPSQSLG